MIWRPFAAALVAIVLTTRVRIRPAAAQWAHSVRAVGEFDSNGFIMVLGGFTVAPARDGWVPLADLRGFWVRYTDAAGRESDLTSISPSLGVRNNFGTGSFAARAGINVSSREVTTPLGSTPDTRDGITNAMAIQYWGSGRVQLEGLASYNHGAENLWSGARALSRLFGRGRGGGVLAGAEVGYLNGIDFDFVQPGIVLGFRSGRGTAMNVALGRRLGDGEDATWIRGEILLGDY